MWSFISNFTPFSTAAGGASPSAGGGHGAVMSPHQVSQPVVVSLSAATLKQVNGLSRTGSRSRLPQDVRSEHSGISDCDMLSDYDFELIDSNMSDWVEIRKSAEGPKDGTDPSAKPKKPLYSAVAKTPGGGRQARAAPIVSIRSSAAQKRRTDPSAKPKKPLYSAVAKTPGGGRQARAAPIVSTRSSAAQRNARKRMKQARNRKFKSHLRDLEVSQAQRLGHTNL